MSRIRVQVEKRDIRLGKPRIPESCAIARAASRSLGVPMSSRKVQVGLTSIMFMGRWFALSRKAQKLIADLDSGVSVKPVTFYAREYWL